MSGYQDIYALVPERETESGWWKLKWRPIWKKTVSAYFRKEYSTLNLGVRAWSNGAHNGWHRSYDHLHIEIGLTRWTLNFWIKWNYVVHKDGPSDGLERRSLDLSKVGVKE